MILIWRGANVFFGSKNVISSFFFRETNKKIPSLSLNAFAHQSKQWMLPLLFLYLRYEIPLSPFSPFLPSVSREE